MSGYDGEVRVNTRLETRKLNSQMMKLENQFDDFSKKAAKALDTMRGLENFTVPTKEYSNLEKQFDSLVDKGKKMAESLKMTDKYVPSEEYTEVNKQLDDASVKLSKLQDRMAKFVETGGKTDSKPYVRMQYDEAELENTIAYAKGELEDLEATGNDKQLNQKWVELKKQMSEVGQEASVVKAKMNEAQLNVKNSVEYQQQAENLKKCNQQLGLISQKQKELKAKQLKNIGQAAKQTSGLLSTMLSRLKGIALSLLVFNWISKGWNAMVTAIKNGVQSMEKYSSDFNARMSEMKSATATLKSSLGTLAAPIISLLTPAIVTLCGWLTNVVNAINKFIAGVSGKSTWTRAKQQQVDYAKSLKGTAAAAKKAAGALASFDDLNVLQRDDTSSDSGGDSTGTSGGGYEEVALTEDDFAWIQKVKEELMGILPIVLFIGAAFLTWKIVDFITSLMKVSPLLGTIVAWVFVIAGAVLAVVSYFKMWKNGVDWKGLIGYIAGVSMVAGGLYALFGPIAAGIAILVAGIAGVILALKDMYQNGVNVKNMTLLLISTFGIIAGVFMAFGAPAAIVVGAIAGIIAIFVLAMAKTGKLQEALGFLQNAFDSLKKFVKDVFLGDWKAAWEDIGNVVKSIANVVVVAFESLINFIIDGLNMLIDKINELGFDMPEIFGGGHVGFSFNHFNHVKFPRLAYGGITTGATLAEIGEAGREAVLPLENNTGWMDMLADKIAYRMPQGDYSERPLILQLEGKTLARTAIPYIKAEYHRIGLA